MGISHTNTVTRLIVGGILVMLAACGSASKDEGLYTTTSPTKPLATNKTPPTQLPPFKTRINETPSPFRQDLTITPIPTFPAPESFETIVELLEAEDNCRLPCWWDIIPGRTSAESAYNLIASLTPRTFGDASGPDFYAEFELPPSTQSPPFFSISIFMQNGIVDSMGIGSLSQTKYGFQRILTDYGMPNEIWASPGIDSHEHSAHVLISILYSSKGILIASDLPGEIVGEKIRVCPHLATNIALGLWTSGVSLRFRQATALTHVSGGPSRYTQIQDLTEISVREFFLTYREEGAHECIDFPVD